MKSRKALVACNPEHAALKSFFVGPQAENGDFLKKEISYIVDSWIDWRRTSFPHDGGAISTEEKRSPAYQKRLKIFQREVKNISDQFKDELPKFSPRYVGHMLSEFSMPALLGHLVCLLHNPNNVSKEASKVGVEIEKLAIRDLALMLGYKKESIGHFTSGGTVANFEAVLRAKMRWLKSLQVNSEGKSSFMQVSHHPILQDSEGSLDLSNFSDFQLGKWIESRFKISFNGPVILVPASKHYSWNKAVSYFGLGKSALRIIPLDKSGVTDLSALRSEIDLCLKTNTPILQVVSICGSTELGTIDPLSETQNLLDNYAKNFGHHFWHHVDAAYGGYFATIKNAKSDLISDHMRSSLRALSRSTSITIDPHKLGYVPYASGAFICQTPNDYFLTQSGAPYLAFDHHRDRGPYTLEGSRSAAGAVATYLTSRCIGLNESGYGTIILRSINNCHLIQTSIARSNIPALFIETEGTNLLCFCIGHKGMKLSEVNKSTQILIEKIQLFIKKNKKHAFYISKTTLGANFSELVTHFCLKHNLIQDSENLLAIRLTIMNPFINSKHTKSDFIEEFTKLIEKLLKIEDQPKNKKSFTQGRKNDRKKILGRALQD